MKRILQSSMLFILLLSTSFSHAAVTGKVVGISDGDTITVLDSTLTQHKIRLWGIDCPESHQDFGTKAKMFTSNLVFGKMVSVETKGNDKYGRSLGIVRIDGNTLNEELLKAGFAWVYMQYCKDSICEQWKRYEESAKINKVGLWAQPNPIPPWEFRHGDKITTISPTPTNASTQKTRAYHGNVKSKVFHAPNCSHYNCTNCTAIFSSRDEAIKLGYRPCGKCNP